MNEFPDDLKVVFRRYREAHPDPEATSTFMPGLWKKIEAKRRSAGSLSMLRRLAQTCVGVAVAAGVILGVFVIPQLQDRQRLQVSSYADVVAIDDAQQEVARVFTVPVAHEIPANPADEVPE